MASKLEQDISAAIDAAMRAGAGGPADDFLGRLADRIGAQANVHAVFGQPIERDGLVVVPVAKVRWGFGGGAGGGPMSMATEASGEPAQSAGSGLAGGGAAAAEPLGWLEIRAEGAEFKPIAPAMPSAAFIFASTFGAAFVLRALARLRRR